MKFLKWFFVFLAAGVVLFLLQMLSSFITSAITQRLENEDKKTNAIQFWFFINVLYWSSILMPVWHFLAGSFLILNFPKIFSIVISLITAFSCFLTSGAMLEQTLNALFVSGRSRGWLWYCAWMCCCNAARIGNFAQIAVDVAFDYSGFAWAKWAIFLVGLTSVIIQLVIRLRMYKENEVEISEAKTARLLRFR